MPHDAADLQEEHGQPRERWPVWAAAALESLRVTPTIRSAAQRAGVDRRTIQRLINRDEEFAVAVAEARDDALDSIEETIVLRARSGQPVEKTVTVMGDDGRPLLDASGAPVVVTTRQTHISDNLAMFFLKRWRPEYRESYRVEQSGPGGGPIQLEGKISDAVGYFEAEVLRLSADRGAEGAARTNGGSRGDHH